MRVTIGCAAGANGDGLAVATLQRPGESEPERLHIPFRCRARPALHGRDIVYAAADAAAAELLRRGVRSAELRVAGDLSADLAERRGLPQALAMPYVRLGCTLNRFRQVVVADGGSEVRDLDRRAEAALTGRIAA